MENGISLLESLCDLDFNCGIPRLSTSDGIILTYGFQFNSYSKDCGLIPKTRILYQGQSNNDSGIGIVPSLVSTSISNTGCYPVIPCLFIDHIALANQGDNALGSVRPSVHLWVCVSPLRNMNMTQFKTKVPEWRCFAV